MKKRAVAYGPPEPELILSAAVIGAKGDTQVGEETVPNQGGEVSSIRSQGRDRQDQEAQEGVFHNLESRDSI